PHRRGGGQHRRSRGRHVLPGRLRVHHARCVRGHHPGTYQGRWSGTGRPRTVVGSWPPPPGPGRGTLPVPPRIHRYPAHQRFHRQVRGVRGGRGRGRGPPGRGGCAQQRRHRLLLHPDHRCDVLPGPGGGRDHRGTRGAVHRGRHHHRCGRHTRPRGVPRARPGQPPAVVGSFGRTGARDGQRGIHG